MMLHALLLAAQAPDAAYRARLDAMVAGTGYATQELNSRWLNNAMAARDPDARELFRRVHADQWAMHADAAQAAEVGALVRRNSDWLKAVLARIGWFDISRYGAEASQAAWLLVQHSDHDPVWQSQMLASLAPRVARGDMQRTYYAYLVDRVEVNAGRPQLYGTQGRCDGPGNLRLSEVRDPEGLAARRAEMGLETIEAYRIRFCVPH
jgi:hypothetical protein